MTNWTADSNFYAISHSVDVPEVTVEELNRYLDENPHETFFLEDPCGCLLHNYLSATRAKKEDECYLVNHYGVGVVRNIDLRNHPVAKLPKKFADFLEKQISEHGDSWSAVNAEEAKTLLQLVEQGELEEASQYLIRAARVVDCDDYDYYDE